MDKFSKKGSMGDINFIINADNKIPNEEQLHEYAFNKLKEENLI